MISGEWGHKFACESEIVKRATLAGLWHLMMAALISVASYFSGQLIIVF
jgi:hypothetical protein